MNRYGVLGKEVQDTVDQLVLSQIVGLTFLTPIEKEVIRRTYGYRWGTNTLIKTQEVEWIATKTGLTIGEVNAIHDSAIDKFRETCRKEGITWRGVSL